MRIQHLDSLRGIAALFVSFHHTFQAFYGYKNNSINDGIYYFFGFIPVIFFFLLSGFVLSRSLRVENGSNFINLISYYIRRVFRLYPAGLISMLISVIIAHFAVERSSLYSNSPWLHDVIEVIKFNFQQTKFINLDNILSLNNVFNTPIWTVKKEFICSFFLPIMAYFLIRFPIIILPTGGVFVLILWSSKFHSFASPMFCFYLGFIINRISRSFEHFDEVKSKIILFFSGILLIFSIKLGVNVVIPSIALGIMLLVLIPCNWRSLKSLLSFSPFCFLGKISYSFYLLHFPSLLLSFGLMSLLIDLNASFYIKISYFIIIFFISVSISFFGGTISEKLIESYFNNLGRNISKKYLLQTSTHEKPLH